MLQNCGRGYFRQHVRTQQNGDGHGCKSLESVQEQREDAEGRGFSRDVGSSNVSTAAQANVFATKDAHEQIAEWNRPQQVTYDDREKESRHSFSLYVAIPAPYCCSESISVPAVQQRRPQQSERRRYPNANVASFVYVDPFGDSWLWYKKNSWAVIVPNSGVARAASFSCRP